MAFRGRVWMSETYRADVSGAEFRVFGVELRAGAAEDSERPEDLLVALELQGGRHSGASYFLDLATFRRGHTAVRVRDDCRCGHLADQHRTVDTLVVLDLGRCTAEGCACTFYTVWE